MNSASNCQPRILEQRDLGKGCIKGYVLASRTLRPRFPRVWNIYFNWCGMSLGQQWQVASGVGLRCFVHVARAKGVWQAMLAVSFDKAANVSRAECFGCVVHSEANLPTFIGWRRNHPPFLRLSNYCKSE